MNFWAKYKAEMDGTEVFENEHGFIAFKELGDHLFVTDCYVHPDFRKDGVGRNLLYGVEVEAIERKKKFVVTSVDLFSRTSTESLRAQLSVGLVPFKADNDKIWLKKPVGD